MMIYYIVSLIIYVYEVYILNVDKIVLHIMLLSSLAYPVFYEVYQIKVIGYKNYFSDIWNRVDFTFMLFNIVNFYF